MKNFNGNLVSLGIASVLAVSSAFIQAEPVAVIVNAKNQNKINEDHVKAIYADLKTSWDDGSRIQMFELPVSSDAREKFARRIFNKSAADTQADWSNRKMNNTIKNQPKIKNDKLVAKFVAKKVSAIGYVPKMIADDVEGIKVVVVIP